MLGPGIPNPMLMAGGDPLDEYGKIDKSVRFRAAANAKMTKTLAAGSRLKWIVSLWVKRSIIGAYQELLSSPISAGSTEEQLRFNTDDTLTLYDGAVGALTTISRVFRDPAAWVHIVYSYDSAQGTAANRGVFYINGEAQTATVNGIGASRPSYINHSLAHAIGGFSSYAGGWFDGGMAHYAFLDGKSIQAGDVSIGAFGAAHPRTGQWRPKSKAVVRAAVAASGGARNGWGVNGFFLPYDDVTSLTTLCYDRSQSDTDTAGNNFTASNISLTAGATYDSSLDTPTNNFCTLNPLANAENAPTNGCLEVSAGATATGAIHGTMKVPRGYPVYWEVENTTLTAAGVSISVGVCRLDTKVSENYELNNVAGIAGFFSSNVTALQKDDGSRPNIGAALSAPGVIHQVAVNGNNGWIGRNNVWFDGAGGTTGNPATGANPTFTISGAHEYLPFVHVYSNTARSNFGQRDFVYAPPTGYKALNTKNLPIKPLGPMKSASAFVAVTDTGANIAATLAAARAGFGSYIDIIKRREASEGWRWIFSDDPANYLDTSTTAAKAAVPAFSGTSYVGYSLKVSAANGVATGTFVHTNGANSVVSDGLSNARKMVILHRESAGGGDFFAYHPDLTAGKLLYLNNTTAETTDASINTVTASGFTAASTLPSGTYRWISIAELSGFISLNSYIANSSADGPFVNAGLSPAFSLQKSTSGSATRIKDIARTPNNLAQIAFDLNLPAAEDPNANSIDNVSNGIKERANDAMNVSAQKYITLLIAAFPFRYANAR